MTTSNNSEHTGAQQMPQHDGRVESRWRSLLPLVIAAILVALSIAVRVAFRGVVTSDLDTYVLRWYAKLQRFGIFVGLGKDFYNYTPPYLYLLAVATLTSAFVSAVTAIKLIATAFDIYGAFMIYKIVRLKYPDGYLPFLAAAIFFSAPTVVANSGVWGQADSTYTAFLLTCLYFLLVSRPFGAIVFFSLALAFKPQAIFFIPLLMVLTLMRRLRWYYFVFVPAVYALAMWPAVALGRTWMEVFTVYSRQAGSGKGLTHNAASVYVFIPKSAFGWLIVVGVFIAAVVLLIWVFYSWRYTRHLDRPMLILMSLISVALTPFLLPNMHDRYFFPADAISLAVAFIMPELWFIPILYQVVSGLSYSIYLLSYSPDALKVAATVNFVTLSYLLWKQVSMNRPRRRPAELSISSPNQKLPVAPR